MNKANEEFKQEVIKELEVGNGISIQTKSGEEYDIQDGANFVGGDKGFFMSSMLGNVQYTEINEIVNDLFELINENGELILEVDY